MTADSRNPNFEIATTRGTPASIPEEMKPRFRMESCGNGAPLRSHVHESGRFDQLSPPKVSSLVGGFASLPPPPSLSVFRGGLPPFSEPSSNAGGSTWSGT